jgi:hypothetical protein
MARADHEKALQQLIENMGALTPERARRLVWFAWQCVQGTPLSDGRTPVARLRGHGSFLNVLRTVGCWLQGESVEQPLRAMHDEVFEAALGVGRFEPDMTGLRAACWSVFELYQAAVAAETGELQAVARKVAWSVFLASRSTDAGTAPAALEYQERLLKEILDCRAVPDGLSPCFSPA